MWNVVRSARGVEPDPARRRIRFQEMEMTPDTFHPDSLWLLAPALAVSFMVWVLWSLWKEIQKH